MVVKLFKKIGNTIISILYICLLIDVKLRFVKTIKMHISFDLQNT
jgi:hypothetical protein